jgi:hypothetical protein
MVLSSDGRTKATGKTPAVTIRKNGGNFAAPAGAVSEIGSGWYRVVPHATDSDTLGSLVVHAEAADCVDTDARFFVVAFNPRLASLGLNNLAAADILTTPANKLATDGSGRTSANVVQIAGQTAVAAAAVTFPASIGTSTFAGGAVTLTSAYDAAKTAASQASVDAIPTNPITSLTGIATTAGLAALQAHGDLAWSTATGFSTLTAAGVRAALGLAAADLDDQLDTLASGVLGARVAAESSDVKLSTARLGKIDVITADIATAATRLLTTLELDGSVYRFTANVLELAPVGEGGGGSGGGLTPEQEAQLATILAHTQLITPGGFTILSPVTQDGLTISATAGDSWNIPFANLGSLVGVQKLWFAVKNQVNDADVSSLLFIDLTGLVYANRADATEPSLGPLVIEDTATGAGRIKVEEAVTVQLRQVSTAKWAIKALTATGDTITLRTGAFHITPASIQAIA